MAIRRWKRKAPPREDKVYKTEIKLESGVFDRHVLLCLDTLLKRKIIESIDYCISTGKEADVYRATASGYNFVAVKIFRTFTSKFKKIDDYMEQEMQRKQEKLHNTRSAWAAKEYKNLLLIESLGIAPKPIYRIQNINVLEFLGENGLPYPLLKDCKHIVGQEEYTQAITIIQEMYNKGLVHADFSEFNILFSGSKLFAIDFAQSVQTNHPKADAFLLRDITNIIRFFNCIKNVKTESPETIFRQIKSK